MTHRRRTASFARTPEDPPSLTPACPACGRTAGPDDRFCGRCGTAIAAGLPPLRPGRTPPTSTFCTGCGQALRRGAGPRPARRARSAAGSACSSSTRSARRPFAEQADPETVRAHQTDFFATVRRIVRQYGGVVEKYIGDAAMVLFGAPVATETDAVRCVRAGLDLQRALARGGRRRAGWTFRVGIATGEALVDVAAAHDGGQAIVAGDVVNTAARLQSEAPPGGVLVCGTTHAADPYRDPLRRPAAADAARPVHPDRGLAGPGPGASSRSTSDTDAIADGRPRPRAGPAHQRAAPRDPRARRPRLVTVLGRAGIGKSRLVRELYQHARAAGRHPVCWRSGRCPPFGENVAYAALADIVKAQAGVLATDTPEAARDRLDAALRDLVPAGESARLSDALRPLVGLPGSPLSTEDAESAWRRFLLALAGRGPTVLVFEDLHWADDRMIRFVELIGATVRDVPLLVVCTARPELVDREPSWAGAVPGMLSISLTPLRDDSHRHPVRADVRRRRVPARAAAAAGRAGRRHAALRPRVRPDAGRAGHAAPGRATPGSWSPAASCRCRDSVHAVIANRIDLLDAGERAVLQAAAVVGARFWPGAVAAALGTGADTVERALRTLAQRDLVREQPDSTMADEPEYRFRHVLVSDVCYERLPLAERIARHVRTADWLDARVDSRGTELAEVVAHHRFTAYETAPRARPGRRARTPRRRWPRCATPPAGPPCSTRSTPPPPTSPGPTELVAASPGRRTGGRRPADAADRLGVELLGIELALHQDATAFLTGAGPDRLAELATLLYRVRRPRRRGPGLDPARPDRLAAAATGRPRCAAWTGRSSSSTAGRTRPEKAQAYAELGRLHMLNYEHVPALGATQIAAEIAERLGLVELRANALITIGMCRYQAGEPDGLVELQDALEFCRTHQLPSLRRAAQSVAIALREEGNGSGTAVAWHA